ncbi:MAG: hypothetical protein PHH60_05000 [Candidatus Margulisbacteria bacterium]|nr:hypothetical protein [Candidatus Margulisiibacteriota bacterium]
MKTYECYPWWSVLIDNLITLSLYAVGFYFLYLIWPWLTAVFFIYLIYIEWSLYREGCRHCYYYGKVCHSGRGVAAKLFCKKGDPKVFLTKTVNLIEFLPQLVPNLAVLLAGIYLMIFRGFSVITLLLTVWPVAVYMLNQVTFGVLGCPHCKQAELGCPVYEMFAPKEKK